MKKTLDFQLIVDKIREAISRKSGFVGLHEPYFRGNEWAYLKTCIDTNWVSSVGKYVDQFEEQLAEFTGVKKAVAVVNGTAALQVSLQLVGVEREDEVLVPALTFVATANAVSYLGAIPHFVDSSLDTLGMDPYKLGEYLQDIAIMKHGECYNRRTGRRIKAVVPMHTFGHPVEMDALLDIAALYKIEVVEDAAESLGSYYKGKHTGNFGKIAALSFNGNKIITTGGGGAILTNDEALGLRAKHLITTAKVPHQWEYVHDDIGYNFRMPNINAALGCAQLENLAAYVEAKRRLAALYKECFQDVSGVTFFVEPQHATSNYWLNTLLLDEADARDELLEFANQQGIMTRPVWKLLHKLEMYKGYPRMDLTIAESLERKVINIPSSVFLGESNGE